MNKMAYDRGGYVSMTREQVEHLNRVQDEFEKKRREFYNANRDRFASAYLKDLGYDDTHDGREYIKKLGLV